MSRHLAAALAALALSGCFAYKGVRDRLPPREPQPGPASGEWGPLRDAASRRDVLYDGLVHRAELSGTWLSPSVRQAGTRQLAEWQSWTPAELEGALAADRVADGKGQEFVVALYTAERRHNDLDARPSIWHVEIDDGTTRCTATAVEAVPSDATTVQLFPFVGSFDTVYRVRVPWTGAPLEGRAFVLRVGSALGKLQLDFGPDGTRARRPHLAP
jgi:hypothetical protein